MLASARLKTILCTTRLNEARQFYGQVLGLALAGTSDGALVFSVGGADLLVAPVASAEPSPHTVVGFAVPDLEAVMASLRARAVVFARFEGLAHDAHGIVRSPDGARVVWLRDPDGNILSIVEYPPALSNN